MLTVKQILSANSHARAITDNPREIEYNFLGFKVKETALPNGVIMRMTSTDGAGNIVDQVDLIDNQHD